MSSILISSLELSEFELSSVQSKFSLFNVESMFEFGYGWVGLALLMFNFSAVGS